MGEQKFRARQSATAPAPSLESLLKRTSLHDSAGPPHRPRFIHRDAGTLAHIRTLPRTGNLILFTPVVPPECGTARSSDDLPMDPFEPLGRALAAHHARVRHVPYVPGVGLTSTHLAFLAHAAAVVLVVCSNAAATFASAPQQRRSHPHPTWPTPIPGKIPSPCPTAAATSFAALFGAAAPAPLAAVPSVLVVVDDDAESEGQAAELDDAAASMGVQTVLRTQSYAQDALAAVADMLLAADADDDAEC